MPRMFVSEGTFIKFLKKKGYITYFNCYCLDGLFELSPRTECLLLVHEDKDGLIIQAYDNPIINMNTFSDYSKSYFIRFDRIISFIEQEDILRNSTTVISRMCGGAIHPRFIDTLCYYNKENEPKKIIFGSLTNGVDHHPSYPYLLDYVRQRIPSGHTQETIEL